MPLKRSLAHSTSISRQWSCPNLTFQRLNNSTKFSLRDTLFGTSERTLVPNLSNGTMTTSGIKTLRQLSKKSTLEILSSWDSRRKWALILKMLSWTLQEVKLQRSRIRRDSLSLLVINPWNQSIWQKSGAFFLMVIQVTPWFSPWTSWSARTSSNTSTELRKLLEKLLVKPKSKSKSLKSTKLGATYHSPSTTTEEWRTDSSSTKTSKKSINFSRMPRWLLVTV